jgi:hypothetical protein
MPLAISLAKSLTISMTIEFKRSITFYLQEGTLTSIHISKIRYHWCGRERAIYITRQNQHLKEWQKYKKI